MKENIRKKFLEKRKEIDKDIKSISKNLFSLDEFKKSNSVHCYLSKEDEVSTKEIIDELFKLNKKVIVPIMKDDSIVSVEIKNTDFKKGKFNVLEPVEYEIYDGKIDIIIVPGITFDKQGRRLGYGKGFYDKFLAKTEALKIALCYEELLSDNLPEEEHDIRMDLLITENKVYYC